MEDYGFRQMLQPGEYILWQGAPVGGIRLQRSDVFMIPFSLLWCGFAVFWEVMAIQSGAPFFFALFGIPFILVGIYIVIGRFFHRARKLANTAYAVTDKRIIILEKRGSTSMLFSQIPSLQKTVNASGIGTIWFQPPMRYHSHHHGSTTTPGIGFEEIADADYVCGLIEGKLMELQDR